MQISLFDDHNICKSAFHRDLQAFNLKGAEASLLKWGESLDAPKNLNKKLGVIRSLNKNMKRAGDSALLFLAQLYITCDSNPAYSELSHEIGSLKQGLRYAIADLLPKNAYEYIIPELHPAEIYVELGEYTQTVNSVDACIAKFGENALLRQIQGYAFYRQGIETSAKIAFGYALFADPLQCNVKYIYPTEYDVKLHYLAEKTGNLQSALIRLPFALWREGKSIITPEASGFEAHLRNRIKADRRKSQKDATVNIMQFNRLLYLAEMIRLRHERRSHIPAMEKLRDQMRQLNPEFYQLFHSTLSAFRNI